MPNFLSPITCPRKLWGHCFPPCPRRPAICASISGWPLCTRELADSLRLQFAAAPWRAFTTMQAIRTKLPVTGNWRRNTKSAAQRCRRSSRRLRFLRLWAKRRSLKRRSRSRRTRKRLKLLKLPLNQACFLVLPRNRLPPLSHPNGPSLRSVRACPGKGNRSFCGMGRFDFGRNRSKSRRARSQRATPRSQRGGESLRLRSDQGSRRRNSLLSFEWDARRSPRGICQAGGAEAAAVFAGNFAG